MAYGFGGGMWAGVPGLLGASGAAAPGMDVYRGLVEGMANGFQPSLGGPSMDLPAVSASSMPPSTMPPQMGGGAVFAGNPGPGYQPPMPTGPMNPPGFENAQPMPMPTPGAGYSPSLPGRGNEGRLPIIPPGYGNAQPISMPAQVSPPAFSNARPTLKPINMPGYGSKQPMPTPLPSDPFPAPRKGFTLPTKISGPVIRIPKKGR